MRPLCPEVVCCVIQPFRHACYERDRFPDSWETPIVTSIARGGARLFEGTVDEFFGDGGRTLRAEHHGQPHTGHDEACTGRLSRGGSRQEGGSEEEQSRGGCRARESWAGVCRIPRLCSGGWVLSGAAKRSAQDVRKPCALAHLLALAPRGRTAMKTASGSGWRGGGIPTAVINV